jgi:NAD(P)H-hydrate epimerase
MSAKKCGIKILRSDSFGDLDAISFIEGAHVVIDALLGTGAKGAPRGEIARLIGLSARNARLVALDVPSGVDADTGEVHDAAVTAEATVTFLAEKPGLAIAPGMFRCGEVVLAGIGSDPAKVLPGSPFTRGDDASDIPGMTPRLPIGIHKGSRGSLLILGGSSNYRGAPLLSALAALRAGCGLVALALPENLALGAEAIIPEAIFIPLPEKGGHVSFDEVGGALCPWLGRFDAMVLGPGLGASPDAAKTAQFLRREWKKPILADADALRVDYGRDRWENAVATPHAGEAAFILGMTADEVGKKCLASCVAMAEKFGTALLKGPHTLISDGCETRVALEGGPELAIPGSGDVLAGVIGAFLAAGMRPIDAATLGAVLHGAAGRRLASDGGKNGLLARELADGIRFWL